MSKIIDLVPRLRPEPSIDDALELIDKILSLEKGQMMMITNIDGELRCQVVEAHWFKTE